MVVHGAKNVPPCRGGRQRRRRAPPARGRTAGRAARPARGRGPAAPCGPGTLPRRRAPPPPRRMPPAAAPAPVAVQRRRCRAAANGIAGASARIVRGAIDTVVETRVLCSKTSQDCIRCQQSDALRAPGRAGCPTGGWGRRRGRRGWSAPRSAPPAAGTAPSAPPAGGSIKVCEKAYFHNSGRASESLVQCRQQQKSRLLPRLPTDSRNWPEGVCLRKQLLV